MLHESERGTNMAYEMNVVEICFMRVNTVHMWFMRVNVVKIFERVIKTVINLST